MQWISINDALPVISREDWESGCAQVKVLVWDGVGWSEAWYQPGTKEFYYLDGTFGGPISGVTHWAIPEPPEGAR